MTAYSPLGSPARDGVKPDDDKLLEEPRLIKLSKKYNKTPTQVLIRYQIQRGHMVIPKSVHKERIVENMDVFDFELTSKDMELINSFDRNGRTCDMIE